MTETKRPPLRQVFARAANPAGEAPPDMAMRRPPVPERAARDHTGEAMSRYMTGLEARFLVHMARHIPYWHASETARLLNKWGTPAVQHPAPNWAGQRDAVKEASDYAAQLLKDRLVIRLRRIHDIRSSRELDNPKQKQALREVFRMAAGPEQKTMKLKI